MSMDSRSSSALFKRAEQLKRWEESDTNRESSELNGTRKIKFPSGCVFLAACAAGDKDEVLKLLKKGADIDTTNVDGLSALHQACIDDNLDMVEFLVEHGADCNKGDNEGWTPLHATASCGFMSIAKYLIDHGANVAAVNNDGELPVDIAESDEMEDMLQQQIEDRGIDADDARNEEERMMLADAKNWLQSGGLEDKLHPKTGATALHVAAAKGYIKVMDLLLQAGANLDAQDFDGWTPLHAAAHWGQREACEILVEHLCDMDMKNYVGQTASDVAENDVAKALTDLRKKQATISKEKIIYKAQNNNKIKSPIEKKPVITDSLPSETGKKVKENEDAQPKVPEVPKVEVEIQPAPLESQNRVEKKNRANRDELERISKITETNKTVPNPPVPNVPPSKQGIVEGDDNNVPSWRRTSGSLRSRGAETTKPNLTLRLSEREAPKAPAAVNPPNRTETPQEVVLRRTQSFEADEKFQRRYMELRAKINAGNSCPALHAPLRTASLKEKHFSRRGQVIKEDTRVTSPVASPVITTVTTSLTTATTTTTVSSTPTSPTSPSPQPNQVRRSFVPPVRDEESETQRKAHAKRVRETRRSTQGVTLEEIKSAEQLVKKKQQQQLQQATQQISSPDQFMLEDARGNSSGESTIVRRAIATPVTDTGDTTVTLPLRRSRTSPEEDKDQDKENDIRTAQATQAVIQRRRRPKRRSTGVVRVDMDEIDPDRQSESSGGSPRESEDSPIHSNSIESGPEKSDSASRIDSTSSPSDESQASTPAQENGEIDYKKLYEESQRENERLREKLRRTEDDLETAKSQTEKNATLHKNSLSEVEKRERRAMERKLSEMEEELKQLEQLKCENQRLKDENGALIRVISKLSK